MIDLKEIKLLIMDCDGVLSDGKVIYTEDNLESKAFDVSDGLGLSLLRFTEIRTAVITGRSSLALQRRCEDLKIDFLFQGVRDKLTISNGLLNELSLDWKNVAYMGDDWNDYPVLERVALAAVPQQAPEEIKRIAGFIAVKRGGNGAVRELIEYILKEQGIFDEVIRSFLNHLTDNETRF